MSETHRTTEDLTAAQVGLLTGGARRWAGAVVHALVVQGLVHCDRRGRFRASSRARALRARAYGDEPTACNVGGFTETQHHVLEVLSKGQGLSLKAIVSRTSRSYRAELAALRSSGLVFRVGKRWPFAVAAGLSAALVLRALYLLVTFDPARLLPTALVLFVVVWLAAMVRPAWHWSPGTRAVLETERDRLRVDIACGEPASPTRALWAYALSGYPEPGQPLDHTQARAALAAPGPSGTFNRSIVGVG